MSEYLQGHDEGIQDHIHNYMQKHKKLLGIIQERLSSARFGHSVRVAAQAFELARKYGENEEHGWLAGMVHDCCREIPEDEMYVIAQKSRDKNILGDYAELYLDNPLQAILYHGLAASVYLHDIVVCNSIPPLTTQIYKAVASHVLGHPGMDNLAKIIYIADAMEPGRTIWGDEGRKKILDLCIIDIQAVAVIEGLSQIYSDGNMHEISRQTVSALTKGSNKGH